MVDIIKCFVFAFTTGLLSAVARRLKYPPGLVKEIAFHLRPKTILDFEAFVHCSLATKRELMFEWQKFYEETVELAYRRRLPEPHDYIVGEVLGQGVEGDEGPPPMHFEIVDAQGQVVDEWADYSYYYRERANYPHPLMDSTLLPTSASSRKCVKPRRPPNLPSRH